MSYTVPETALEAEQLRHRYLAQLCDPESKRIFDAVGVSKGWRCLEVGAGSCSVARHLAERVGAEGEVTATDVDTRLAVLFASDPPAHLKVLQHDIMSDELPRAYYDMVHSRALLEHLPDPELGLLRMKESLRPGGWFTVECSDFTVFEQQHASGAFAELIEKMRSSRTGSRDEHRGYLGRRLLSMLRALGLRDVQIRGHVWQMQANQPTLEWLLIALEWGAKEMIGAELLEAALAQARSDDFSVLSPLHLSAWGQLP